MKNNNVIISLADGRQVSWEEFSSWSAHKQRMGLNPHAKNMVWGVDHSNKMRQIVKESYEKGTRKINWNFGGKNGMAKAVMTPAGKFSSLKEARDHYGVSTKRLRDWMHKTRCTEFYFLETTTGDTGKGSKAKVVITPDGKFDSINAAARRYSVGARTIKTWIRTTRKNEFSYSE